MPFGMGLPCAARALALVALLASGCTLGLDWSPNAITSPDASLPDAEPQPDAPVVDSGAVDTGVVTGRCGGHDERCCSFGACMMGRICLQRMGEPAALCRDCGGNNQPCCAFGVCDRDRVCELRMGAPVCR
jgi:hypothetical protein